MCGTCGQMRSFFRDELGNSSKLERAHNDQFRVQHVAQMEVHAPHVELPVGLVQPARSARAKDIVNARAVAVSSNLNGIDSSPDSATAPAPAANTGAGSSGEESCAVVNHADGDAAFSHRGIVHLDDDAPVHDGAPARLRAAAGLRSPPVRGGADAGDFDDWSVASIVMPGVNDGDTSASAVVPRRTASLELSNADGTATSVADANGAGSNPAPMPAAETGDAAAVQFFKAYAARDPALVVHKAMYTALFASWSCFSPYLSVLLFSFGFNPTEIGAIAAISPLCQLVAAPAWSALADRGYRRIVFVGTLLAATAFRACLWFARSSVVSVAFVVLLFEGFAAPQGSMLDASTLAVLEATSNTARYGRTRLWGAIGWGTFALVAGALVDRFGHATVILLVVVTHVPVWILGWRLPVDPRAFSKTSARVDWRALLGNVDVALFFVVAFLSGVMIGVMANFQFLWLEELGASSTLLGVTQSLACASEVPFFFISEHVLRKFGVMPVLAATMTSYLIRVAWYSALTDPWWTLPAELLHGITFALGWSASTNYAFELLPRELAATAQALLAAAQWGLGCAVGAVVGGVIYSQWGARVLFRASACAAAAGVLLMLVSFERKRRAKAKGVQLQDTDRDAARPGTEGAASDHQAQKHLSSAPA